MAMHIFTLSWNKNFRKTKPHRLCCLFVNLTHAFSFAQFAAYFVCTSLHTHMQCIRKDIKILRTICYWGNDIKHLCLKPAVCYTLMSPGSMGPRCAAASRTECPAKRVGDTEVFPLTLDRTMEKIPKFIRLLMTYWLNNLQFTHVFFFTNGVETSSWTPWDAKQS